MVFPGVEQRWWRVVFDFGEIGNFVGVLGLMYESLTPTIERSSIVRKILASLPICTESVVFDEIELLIKLPLRFKQKIFKRDHTIKRGEIIYRPHIPSISIFTDTSEIYEPVEKIGLIRKDDIPKFMEIVNKINNKASIYVEIRKYEPKVEAEETEEEAI